MIHFNPPLFVTMAGFILIGNFTLFQDKENTLLATLLPKTTSSSFVKHSTSIKNNSLCKEQLTGKLTQEKKKNILPVFKRDGSRQCEENTGIPVKEMEKELQNIGVKVFKAVKGHLISSRGLSVCGSPTSNINIFYISSNKKTQVLNKGFYSCIEK